jgi:hypothetical protein
MAWVNSTAARFAKLGAAALAFSGMRSKVAELPA